MTKICEICGKGSIVAGGYSNRVRATKYNPTGKRRQKPNLQWSRTAENKRILTCTKCLKRSKLVTR